MTKLTKSAFLRVGSADLLSARARALSQALPGHIVVARRTAAWLWGLDVLPPGVTEATWPVELLLPSGRTPPRRAGCVARQSALPLEDVTEVSGVRVTTMARTALDCARWLPRLEAVAALDQFLRGDVDPQQLAGWAALLAGRRNARHLREVIDLSDSGAALPGESWTRTIIIDAGFPRPRTQIPVMGPRGATLFLDMGYEQFLTAVEYDGEEFHTRPEDRAHDTARRGWLRNACGWEVIVVTREDILFTPAPFLEALATTLMRRGWDPAPVDLERMEIQFARLRRHRPLSQDHGGGLVRGTAQTSRRSAATMPPRHG